MKIFQNVVSFQQSTFPETTGWRKVGKTKQFCGERGSKGSYYLHTNDDQVLN